MPMVEKNIYDIQIIFDIYIYICRHILLTLYRLDMTNGSVFMGLKPYLTHMLISMLVYWRVER